MAAPAPGSLLRVALQLLLTRPSWPPPIQYIGAFSPLGRRSGAVLTCLSCWFVVDCVRSRRDGGWWPGPDQWSGSDRYLGVRLIPGTLPTTPAALQPHHVLERLGAFFFLADHLLQWGHQIVGHLTILWVIPNPPLGTYGAPGPTVADWVRPGITCVFRIPMGGGSHKGRPGRLCILPAAEV